MARIGEDRALAAALVVLACGAACRDRGPAIAPGGAAPRASAQKAAEPPEHEAELAALRAFEQARRAETDFATLPPSDVALGPDPYRIAALRDGRQIGLLRGASAVVLLDRDGAERARIAAPRAPGGLAVSGHDDVLVVGEAARELVHYRVEGDRLVRVGTLPIDALGLRDVAVSPDGQTAYVVEEREGRLLALKLARGVQHGHTPPAGPDAIDRAPAAPSGGAVSGGQPAIDRVPGAPPGRAPGAGRGATERAPGDISSAKRRGVPDSRHALRVAGVRELARCHGPTQVQVVAGHVAVNCLLDHTIELRRGDGEVARIRHDGPLWGFALHREPDGGLLVAAGGVEDHPLEREDGGFGYIDSYVYLYRLAPGASQAAQLATINASALGVVTPKWLAIHDAAGAVAVTTAGYGSAGRVTLTWRDGHFTDEPRVESSQLPPGTAAAQLAEDGTLIAANPLLDAWVVQRGGAARVVPVESEQPPRTATSRIGELVFFTTLMSPWGVTEGKLSRFTCETCHHEGYVDGRVHFTGRGDVHATTRPLYGLFNNRPHFSRALDKTMTQMVHAEFRVANRHNGRDPWFAVTRAEAPWLADVTGAPPTLSPELLREALMTFLMAFTHRANPAAIDHTRFTELERAGALAFRDRCAACHAPRLVADEPASAVAFERWESLVLSPAGAIVWSNAAYEQTGVTPYVHASGARVPTLRRLYKKWPYFTNGRARSIDEVLGRFAAGPRATYHDSAPADATLRRLDASEQAALRAFLELL